MKNIFLVVFAGLLVTACDRTPPELKAVVDAANALGGKERVLAIKTLTIEGEGSAPNVGQNTMPEGELPVWKVTEFKRAIDLGSGRMRTDQLRTAQFLFANAPTQRQHQGLDGDVAYNVNGEGESARASETAVTDRRIEMLHHPIVIVRAALDPQATVSGLRTAQNQRIVEIRTSRGEALTLAIDAATNLPTRVTSMTDNPNMGDVAIDTSFSEYEDLGGVKMPRRLTTKIDKYLQFDLVVSKNTVDGEPGDLSAPAAVKAMPAPPATPAVVVTAEPVGKGIWWLAGSGNHRSVVFEFDDHLVLYEVPLNVTRSKAVIDKARSLSAKPLTDAIVSHHHFDHSGGLRVAVAEGLTITTYKDNVDFFKDLVARPHTIAPDALSRNPKPLKVKAVDDSLTLKDASMEVDLYHLKDNPREGTNLFAYVPRDRILVQADLYDSTWLYHYWGENVITNIENVRHLKVDKQVPVHGAIQTYAEMVRTIKAKERGPQAN